jgi:protein-S-isoprenylcysteine O-methyltransferase Ste14
MTARSTLGRPIALAAVYLERYGISIVFFFLAAQRLHQVLALTNAAHSGSESFPLADIIRQLIWIQLYLYSGVLLLLGRRVTALPQRIEDILLPLGTTFFYLAYNAIPWFPGPLKNSLLPAGWQTPFLVTGLILNVIGLWIAIWAAIYLGRSFGVLIEVRKVVLEGAYKRMRHPMYSGYLCFLAGFAMTNFSIAFLVLIPLHMFLLLYRARLEEERLSACSPEYAEYRKRTGFVFPRFGQD